MEKQWSVELILDSINIEVFQEIEVASLSKIISISFENIIFNI
jgi:hypothetical protein